MKVYGIYTQFKDFPEYLVDNQIFISRSRAENLAEKLNNKDTGYFFRVEELEFNLDESPGEDINQQIMYDRYTSMSIKEQSGS